MLYFQRLPNWAPWRLKPGSKLHLNPKCQTFFFLLWSCYSVSKHNEPLQLQIKAKYYSLYIEVQISETAMYPQTYNYMMYKLLISAPGDTIFLFQILRADLFVPDTPCFWCVHTATGNPLVPEVLVTSTSTFSFWSIMVVMLPSLVTC